MPAWTQIVLAVSTVFVGLAALWSKVLRPGMRFANNAEQMLPLLQDLTVTFRDTPGAFKILNQIIAQFRTDSGSTLRDVVNRLEVAANDNKAASELLKVGVETAKQLAEQDREQLRRLILLLDRLTLRVDQLMVSGQRIEEDRTHVAEDLAAREKQLDAATAGVADDLVASRLRADDAVGDPGAAADAASQNPAELAEGP